MIDANYGIELSFYLLFLIILSLIINNTNFYIINIQIFLSIFLSFIILKFFIDIDKFYYFHLKINKGFLKIYDTGIIMLILYYFYILNPILYNKNKIILLFLYIAIIS
jgi:hypothetical protein